MKQANTGHIDLSALAGLKDKILYVILVLAVFRLGSYIPLPGVNINQVAELFSKNSSGILGMFNVLSGGSFSRMSIFSLSIMPYITASIIMQIMTVLSKSLESLRKEGESGRKAINKYTKYLTLLLSSLQAYGLTLGLESVNLNNSGNIIIINSVLLFRFISIVSLVTGTMMLMWMGERINKRGIGNGISLIIFSGIIANLPNALASLFELAWSGVLSSALVVSLIFMALILVSMVIFFERSLYKVKINYPKRQVGNKIYNSESSYLPLKLNTAGVIPPIFATSILLFPMTIANFTSSSDGILALAASYLSHGKPIYIIFYISLIIFFAFFYTAIVFNPEDTADNLKKHGGFIAGLRPGQATAEYLDKLLSRITFLGALYIAFICAIPEIMIAKYSLPFALGGTSLLIVVNVIMDSFTQIQTHIFSTRYSSFFKKQKRRSK